MSYVTAQVKVMNLSSMELNGSVEPIVLMVSLEVLILDDNHFTRTPPGLERLKQVKRLKQRVS